MKDILLTKTIKILLLLILMVVILVYAKPFLVPFAFAALFSMLLLPLSVRMQKWGMKSGLAIFLSILFFVLIISGILSIIAWQISDIAANSDEIEKNINQKIRDVRNYFSEQFGISRQKQNEMIADQKQSSGGNVSGVIAGILGSMGSFLTNLLLTLVYVFLFLFFRMHLKKFILMLVPAGGKKEANQVISEAKEVAQKYISGMAWMILCLWIMYSIGFSIVGVNNAIFFAILCGLFEIVPFVGNLAGNLLTVLAVVMQGGSSSMILGVVITYGIVQFLQTYILEPLVVGKGVNLNPLFTIAGIVAGELIWGIPGMILAIPMLGIAKIICDHVENLKPYGFLIGEEKKNNQGLMDKMKKWFK